MGLKKRVFRCGCNNSSISLPSVNNGNRTCCQNCVGAPCAYSIMSDCVIWTHGGEKLLDRCTLLKKDCITGCTWSSRWTAAGTAANSDFPIESPYCDFDRCGRDIIPQGGCNCYASCIDFTINSYSGTASVGYDFDGFGFAACAPDLTCVTYCLENGGVIPPGDAITVPHTMKLSPNATGVFVVGASGCNYAGLIRYHNGGDFCAFDVLDPTIFPSPIRQKEIAVSFEPRGTRIEYYDGFYYASWLERSVTCGYSGTAVSELGPSGATFNIGTANAYPSSQAGVANTIYPQPTSITIVPSDGCGYAYSGTAGSNVSQTKNVSIGLPPPAECHWDETQAQGGECSFFDTFISPCKDNPPSLDTGYTGTSGTAGIVNFRKWILTMNGIGGTASPSTLFLRTREGYEALYEADVLSCKDPTTFNLQSYDSPLKFLPPRLCVLPIESVPPRVCETGTAQCACCDKGDNLRAYVVMSGCGAFAAGYSLDMGRTYEDGNYPCGVSYPAEAPCGVFTAEVSSVDPECNESLYLMFYCDGVTYNIDVYCYDTDALCWVSQGAATVTNYECLCYGPLFYFTLPDLDCCCPSGGCPADPETDFPDLTLTLSSTCPSLDGCVVSVTYLMGAWTGVATCGGLSVFVSISCQGDGLAWQLVISIPGCSIPNNDNGYTTSLSESPPSLTAVWDDYVVSASDAGCCGGVDITIGAVLTS